MTPRLPISATLVTLNEATHIMAAIESVAFCQEILVVDSGSTDGTVTLAEQAGARVIHHDWPGYVEQKNYAVDQARGEWILALDADERITPELREEIQRLFASDQPTLDAYRMPRLSFYLGRWIRHGGWYPDRKIRLFKKSKARWGGVNPHDRVETQAPVGLLRGDLLHYPYPDIRKHIEAVNRYTTIAAQEKQRRGLRARWYNLTLEPPLIFLKKYFVRLGFLDGFAGFFIAVSTALYVYLKYAKLREIWREEEGEAARVR